MILITSTGVASWLGMQAVHEAGHVLGAKASGGAINQVVLHPLTISRTDLAEDPAPLFTVWAGPLFGVLSPLAIWGIAAALRMRGVFVLRFFAGFCLIANGAYIGVGSFEGIGDCGQMLRHGSERWQLWLFGVVTVPSGFWLWHRQGVHFGLGAADGNVDRSIAYAVLAAAIMLLVLGLVIGGK